MLPTKAQRQQQGTERNRAAVESRDHQQGHEIIHHDHGEQEGPDPIRKSTRHQRQEPEGEGGVGGHRHPPTGRRLPTGVQGQEDPDRHDHAPQARQHGKRDATSLSQLAQIEFPACLQAHHEKEEGHQAAVDPLAQGQGDANVS